MNKKNSIALAGAPVLALAISAVNGPIARTERDPNRNGSTLLSAEPFRQWDLPGRFAFEFAGHPEVEVPTTLTHLGQQKFYDDCLLLAGKSDSDGIIELFDVTPDSVVLRQRLTVPQADFVGVIRGKYTKTLYILERNAGTLLQADWPTETGLVENVSGWQVLATSSAFDQLLPDRLDEMHLRGGEQPDESAFIEVVPFISQLGLYTAYDRWGYIRSSAGQNSFMSGGTTVHPPMIHNRQTTTSSQTIVVSGDPGQAFEFVELDAPNGGAFHVRFSGTLDQDGSSSFPFAQAALGSAYFVRSPDTLLSAGPVNICHEVVGSNDSLGILDASISSFGNVGWRAFAGNDDFVVPLRFEFGPNADSAGPTTIPSFLLVGVEGASTIVDVGNGRHLLSGAVAVDAEAVIQQVDLPVVALVDLPLPQSAAGLNLQFQWVVVEDVNTFSVSEVCTLRVWGEEWPHNKLYMSDSSALAASSAAGNLASPQECLEELCHQADSGEWNSARTVSPAQLAEILSAASR